jgi:hypothetical protein
MYRAPAPAPPTPDESWRGLPAEVAKSRGTGPFYLVAFACSVLSLDTAVRFFSKKMGIDGLKVNIDGLGIHGFSVELAAVCGIGELALISCGYAMRHNARRADGKPGAPQWVAFAVCAAAVYMAFNLEGFGSAAIVRSLFGPIFALVFLHLALQIEVKVHRGVSSGTLSRVGRELRERALSRLGLADDDRPALERTRNRAADRAARLAAGGWLFPEARLRRATRIAEVGLDEGQRDRMLKQIAVLKNVSELRSLKPAAPWVLHAETPVVPAPTGPAEPPVVPPSRELRPVRAIEASQKSTAETAQGWEAKRRQVADAIAFVRSAETPLTAKAVGQRFTRSESWGRDILKRAAEESPNGKAVLTPQ